MNNIYKSEMLGGTLDFTNNRFYFWGGFCSQWAKCNIYDAELDVTFNCAEQAMMAKKAQLFDDVETFNKIMLEKNPREQKKLGRLIKDYKEEAWEDVRLNIVENINYLKFSQNMAWRELLLLLHGKEIVEASPYDKIWGIGLAEHDERIFDKSQWLGRNLLGIAIKNAQYRIIEEL
jgi:ribA/ribD-fused uncharacterized protein